MYFRYTLYCISQKFELNQFLMKYYIVQYLDRLHSLVFCLFPVQMTSGLEIRELNEILNANEEARSTSRFGIFKIRSILASHMLEVIL